MAIKINIGVPSLKKTKQIELSDEQSKALFDKRLGETIKGELVAKTKNLPAIKGKPPAIVVAAGRAAQNAWRDFFAELQLENPNTHRAYNHSVRRFLTWCHSAGKELGCSVIVICVAKHRFHVEFFRLCRNDVDYKRFHRHSNKYDASAGACRGLLPGTNRSGCGPPFLPQLPSRV